MIYETVQPVEALALPRWSQLISGDWAEADSPAGTLIGERRRLLARRDQIVEGARKRREEVTAEWQQAKQGATVTAGSAPSEVAQATAIATSAPQILAQIDAEARRELDAVQRQLAAVEHDLQRWLTPLVHVAQNVNRRVAEYGDQAALLQRSGGDHGESLPAHEALALVGVNVQFFERVFEQVAGRSYAGEWGVVVSAA